MTMLVTKKFLSPDLENVDQGHHLQKMLYLSYYITDFYQNFIEVIAQWLATKLTSADLENVGQGHCVQKSLYFDYYMTNCNETFITMVQLGVATKASHQLTLKM